MERPTCKCHGEPMTSSGVREGRRRWRCAVRNRDRLRRLYADPAFAAKTRERVSDHYRNRGGKELSRKRYHERKDAGLCVNCGAPALSETCCWDCLNRMEERRALS